MRNLHRIGWYTTQNSWLVVNSMQGGVSRLLQCMSLVLFKQWKLEEYCRVVNDVSGARQPIMRGPGEDCQDLIAILLFILLNTLPS